MSSWSSHKKSCDSKFVSKDALISELKKDKDDLKQQLAAKDRQIEELIKANKKPRTVTNHTTNRYVVEQHINVFGKETLGHITPEQIQHLLADPENAVAKFVKLKHRASSNANVEVSQYESGDLSGGCGGGPGRRGQGVGKQGEVRSVGETVR
jgi:hypothetical protein|eukprot:7391527-Prymnesium_polylepis.2